MEWPNRLRELRESRGMTVQDVARGVGVSVGTISKHERGIAGLDGTMIDRYRRFFKVLAVELFTEYDRGDQLTPGVWSVYELSTPSRGVFYVGCAKNPNRLRRHLHAALVLRISEENWVKDRIIQQAIKDGEAVSLTVVFETTDKDEAHRKERELIKARCDEDRLVNGHGCRGTLRGERLRELIAAAS